MIKVWQGQLTSLVFFIKFDKHKKIGDKGLKLFFKDRNIRKTMPYICMGVLPKNYL